MAAILLLALVLSAPLLSSAHLVSDLQASDFSGFAQLLEHAGLLPDLEAQLQAGHALTVFAPTDEALLHGVSPTLLAFLKLQENKAQLRAMLLGHVVTERLSPFNWEGAHASMDPAAPVHLSMDAQAFYAQGVAVTKYNALLSGPVTVHAVTALIMPADMGEKAAAAAAVQDGTDLRRALLGGRSLAEAPAPAPVTSDDPMTGLPKPEAQPGAASAGVVASAFTLAAAVAAATLLL